MKIVKILLDLAVLAIAAIVGIGFLFVSQADKIAKEAIEQGGTYAMGVETTVDSVDIGWTTGSFAMSGFKIANPAGYDAKDRFFGLGSTGVTVDSKSFQSDLITVPTLNMNDVQINLLKKDGKANYDVILDNLKRFESGEKAEPAPSEGEGPGFIINEIRITNIDVYAAFFPIGGDLTAVPIQLDEVVLTDVGQPSGVKMEELMNIIVKALLSAVANKAGDLPGGMGEELLNGLANLESLGDLGIGVISGGTEIIEGVGAEATKALEDATKAGEDAIDDAKKAAEDLTKGLGNLLGGDDNDN